MSKQESLDRSRAVAAEWERLNNDLAKAVTFRMLYFRAYSYLSVCVQDQVLGVISLGQLHQRYAMLSEALAVHAARVKEVTAVSSPDVSGPRWSELER